MNSKLIRYGNDLGKKVPIINENQVANHSLHPAWLSFIRFCRGLQHGEVERLKIQDGLPVLAEVTTKKVKFGA